MTRNCKRVSTDPEFGCCNVSCSKVMALLQQPPNMREMVVNHVDNGVNIVSKRSRKQADKFQVNICRHGVDPIAVERLIRHPVVT